MEFSKPFYLLKSMNKCLKITVIRKINKNNEPVYLEYRKRIIYSRNDK